MKLNLSKILFAAFAIATIGLLSYYLSLQNGFVWDDNFQITRNPYLGAEHSWHDVFTTDVWGYIHPGPKGLSNYYRPLQMLSYRLLRGDPIQATPYHWLSLLLNIFAAWAACALIFLLCKQPWIALSGALLFVAHPIHSEAVLWISALSDVGCTLFYFLAFALYLFAWQGPSPPAPSGKVKGKPKAAEVGRRNFKIWAIIASLVAFSVSLLWKEMAVTFPILIAVHVLVTLVDESWKLRLRVAALRSAPYWIALAAYLLLRYVTLGYLFKAQQAWALTPIQYVLSTIELVGQYWLKLVWPVPLNSYYVFHPAKSIVQVSVLAAILFLGISAAGLVWARRRWPIPTFSALWVFVTLIPVLNLRGLGTNVFTERYLYLPSLGFCLLICWAVGEALKRFPTNVRRAVAALALAVVVSASVIQVQARAADWQDDFTLFTSAAQFSPDSAVVHDELGQLYRDQKHDLIASEREFQASYNAASAATPQDNFEMARAMIGLAGIAYAQRQMPESLAFVAKALAIDPSNGDAHVAKGLALLGLRRFDEAKQTLEEAESLYPNDEVVLKGLGAVALAQKQNDKAIEYFLRVTKINPGSVDAYSNLGRAWTEQGRFDQAIPALRHAIELAPQIAMSHVNLGIALGRAGSFEEARSELEQALAIDPTLTWAQQSLQTLNQMAATASSRSRHR